MSESLFKLTVEGEHIRVTKSVTGRSKTIMVTSPDKIIDQIGSKVQAASHKEVLQWISDLETEEVRNDTIFSDFAGWALTTKKEVAEAFGERGVPEVLAAWMEGRWIAESTRRRIVFYLLVQRAETDDELKQLIAEFEDVIEEYEE